MPDTLKIYPSPWEGRLILACRKCQKKLKHDNSLSELAKLKKTIKRRNKVHPERTLTVINVSCMDLCPKDGVTVCDPCSPARLSILMSADDLDRL
jgi:predicted metal-binding protein